MLLLTFLGLLLLLVDFTWGCWISWFPALGSRAYGQTLMFCLQTQWVLGGITQSKVIFVRLCFEGDPQ